MGCRIFPVDGISRIGSVGDAAGGTRKPLRTRGPEGFRYHSGGGIRTRDLRVMSPTSYQAAPPRDACDDRTEGGFEARFSGNRLGGFPAGFRDVEVVDSTSVAGSVPGFNGIGSNTEPSVMPRHQSNGCVSCCQPTGCVCGPDARQGIVQEMNAEAPPDHRGPEALRFDSGGGIRTRDLRVMSPTSYQAAPPRDTGATEQRAGLKPDSSEESVGGFPAAFRDVEAIDSTSAAGSVPGFNDIGSNTEPSAMSCSESNPKGSSCQTVI